jgi:hypothetical protein
MWYDIFQRYIKNRFCLFTFSKTQFPFQIFSTFFRKLSSGDSLRWCNQWPAETKQFFCWRSEFRGRWSVDNYVPVYTMSRAKELSLHQHRCGNLIAYKSIVLRSCRRDACDTVPYHGVSLHDRNFALEQEADGRHCESQGWRCVVRRGSDVGVTVSSSSLVYQCESWNLWRIGKQFSSSAVTGQLRDWIFIFPSKRPYREMALIGVARDPAARCADCVSWLGENMHNVGWLDENMHNVGWMGENMHNVGWMGENMHNVSWMGENMHNVSWMGENMHTVSWMGENMYTLKRNRATVTVRIRWK